jgi:hypothetical protein
MPLLRALSPLAALLAALCLAALPATAESPLFTVERVQVDVTADSATAARTQGLNRAHRAAFDRLVERLVPRNELERVPEVPLDRLKGLVRDFEVFDEQTSNVRYLAKLTFRFHPEGVRALLRANDVPFAETRSKPVVVLPVWGSGESAVLWSNPNPWRAAWADRAEQVGLVPLTVPLGDLADIRAVDAQQAIEADRKALKAIAEQHGADDVLVTQARLAGDPEAHTASMQVITSRIGTPEMERTLVDNVQQRAEESLEHMLARAADRVARDVEETWKRANLLRYEETARLEVEVPLDGLQRWVAVRRRLAQVARVQSVALDALTRKTAHLELSHVGAREQLALALRQADLVLERTAPDADGAADAGAPGENDGQRDGWRLRAAEMDAPDPGRRAGDQAADGRTTPASPAQGRGAPATAGGIERRQLPSPGSGRSAPAAGAQTDG